MDREGREKVEAPGQQIRENPEVTRLLDRGKQQGVLTYDEINEALRDDALDPEQLEDVLQSIADEGIQVVDQVKDLPSSPALPAAPPEEASLKDFEIRDEDGGQ